MSLTSTMLLYGCDGVSGEGDFVVDPQMQWGNRRVLDPYVCLRAAADCPRFSAGYPEFVSAHDFDQRITYLKLDVTHFFLRSEWADIGEVAGPRGWASAVVQSQYRALELFADGPLRAGNQGR